MNNAEDTYIKWNKSAKCDLKDFESNYERGDYYRCLYFLQQAVEKGAKALLFSLGFASERQVSDFINKQILKRRTPKSYGHDWRDGLIDQLSSLSESPLFREFLPVLRDGTISNPQTALKKAGAVKNKKEPSQQDVEIIITLVNDLLDQSDSPHINEQIDEVTENLRLRLNEFVKIALESKDPQKIVTLAPKFFEEIMSPKGIREMTKFYGSFMEIALSENLNPSLGTVNVDSLMSKMLTMRRRMFPLASFQLLSVFLTPCFEMRYPSDVNISGFIPKLRELEKVVERSIEMGMINED